MDNKNVFLTGATGGIGTEIVKLLAKENYNLFLTSTNSNKLRELEKELKSINSSIQVSYATADLREVDQLSDVIIKAKTIYKNIDILINCAGIYIIRPIQQLTVKDYLDSFNINVFAPFLLCREFSKEMKINKWGRIINIGSVAALYGMNEHSMYCASKHALLGLSRALYEELKPDIRVYCINPSGAKTRMGKLIKPKQNYDTLLDPKEIAEYVSFILKFDKELISNEITLNRIER